MESKNELIKADPYVLMDRLDDKQIVQSLKGEDPKVLIYSMEVWDPETKRKKMVRQLSKRGSAWAANRMAEEGEILRCDMPQVIDKDDESITYGVIVRRFRRNPDGTEIELNNHPGVKRQTRKAFRKNGPPADDPFFMEKAASKAVRNGIFNFVPQTWLVRLIEEAMKIQGAVQEIKEEDAIDADYTEDDSWEPITDEAMSKIRDLYAKIVEMVGKEVADAFYKATKLGFKDAEGKPLYSIEKASLQSGREIYRILADKIRASEDIK